MSTCYKTSDNKYFDCPPRMSDGRHFTDYRPNCEMNSVVKMDNKISNSFEYRNFLQQNASLILDINRKHACQKNCCGPTCQEAFQNSTMLPEKYKVNCDNHTCTRVLNDPKGLGDGRVYYTTPESCEGLPASWPQSARVGCQPNQRAGCPRPRGVKSPDIAERLDLDRWVEFRAAGSRDSPVRWSPPNRGDERPGRPPSADLPNAPHRPLFSQLARLGKSPPHPFQRCALESGPEPRRESVLQRAVPVPLARKSVRIPHRNPTP